MKYILNYNGDVEQDMGLTFEFGDSEIKPNGSNIPVTNANRREFVDCVIDYIFNSSVKAQFEAFKDGFMLSAGNLVLGLFCPEELCLLINGEENLNFADLQIQAIYFGYSPTDKAIKLFWEVFLNDFSYEEKKKGTGPVSCFGHGKKEYRDCTDLGKPYDRRHLSGSGTPWRNSVF